MTVVIAARNEEEGIVTTLERIAELDYQGPVEVVLADNGSTDRTAERAEERRGGSGSQYRRVFEAEPGKHHALNAALHRDDAARRDRRRRHAICSARR